MIDNQDVKSNIRSRIQYDEWRLKPFIYYKTDDGYETEMTRMGVVYNVFENLSVHGHMTQYEGESCRYCI